MQNDHNLRFHMFRGANFEAEGINQYDFRLDDTDGIHSFFIVNFEEQPPETKDEETTMGTIYEVEFPTLIQERMTDTIKYAMGRDEYKTVVVPMFSYQKEVLVKSFNRFITASVITHANTGLCKLHLKLKTKDLGIFYVGPGIILDKEYSPLLLATMTYTIYPARYSNVSIATEPLVPAVAIPKNIKCYIHPRVMLEQDSYLHKGIVQHYCKMCMTTPFPLSHIDSLTHSRLQTYSTLADVVVSDKIESFFYRIAEPEEGLDFKSLNFCLNEYLNTYVEDMFHILDVYSV